MCVQFPLMFFDMIFFHQSCIFIAPTFSLATGICRFWRPVLLVNTESAPTSAFSMFHVTMSLIFLQQWTLIFPWSLYVTYVVTEALLVVFSVSGHRKFCLAFHFPNFIPGCSVFISGHLLLLASSVWFCVWVWQRRSLFIHAGFLPILSDFHCNAYFLSLEVVLENQKSFVGLLFAPGNLSLRILPRSSLKKPKSALLKSRVVIFSTYFLPSGSWTTTNLNVTAKKAPFDLHIPSNPFIVWEYEVQQSTSSHCLFYHFEE